MLSSSTELTGPVELGDTCLWVRHYKWELLHYTWPFQLFLLQKILITADLNTFKFTSEVLCTSWGRGRLEVRLRQLPDFKQCTTILINALTQYFNIHPTDISVSICSDKPSTDTTVFSSLLSFCGRYLKRKWILPPVLLREHRFLLCSIQGQCEEHAGRILSP